MTPSQPFHSIFLLSDTASDNLLKVEKFENLILIGINRPERRNAVNHKTAVALKKAFEEFNADESADAAVLYGVGRACLCQD